jgi:polysaccharide export outer membrane protein
MVLHKSMKINALLAFAWFLVAAPTWPQSPVEQAVPAQEAPGRAIPGQAAASVTPDYIIGPGDTLQVFVWRNPELTTSVPVRPDGKISTPLVEDMIAVGKNPSTLARDIERVLAEYVRSPQVNVIVSQPASAFSQVKVIGQVARPQAIVHASFALSMASRRKFAFGSRRWSTQEI